MTVTGPLRSVEEHRAAILDSLAGIAPLARSEVVSVAEAAGRVLAEDVTADLSVPPFDHAAMDGFAVRVADVAGVSPTSPVELPVAGVVAAGDGLAELAEGTAIRVMTGAPVPTGAELVIPFEWTSGADPVRILRAAAAGRHVRRTGEDVAAGEIALTAGTRLGPAQIGLLVSVGCPAVAVRARPRLAVLSTGSELRRTDATRGSNAQDSGFERAGSVPDSNAAALMAAGRALGADVEAFGPASDDADDFRRRLAAAVEAADLVVTTGGISVGDHDVVKAALADDPAFWFGPVAMKPGRPQGCGVMTAGDGRRVPVVTLPGTPIAALAAHLLYVAPALRALAGRPPRARTAPLAVDVDGTDRTVLLPGRYDDQGRIAPLPGHAGHSQRLLAAADALIVVPSTGRVVPAGTSLEVLALHREED